MPRNRYSTVFYLLLVFGSGIMVGVFSHWLYMTSSVTATAPPRTSDEVRKKYLADMRAKVGVDDTQLAAVNTILDGIKQKVDKLHKEEKPLWDHIQQEQIDSISAVLTPTQKTAYDAWRVERARLAAEDKKRKQGK